ncbi:altered inheritance rate of mitochondria protein 25 isoform X2 [Jatropha curcas]|uniref:altered inheritance rate of mitochondria protein 25 isoform X2 n=1 Tax=Jatropha curcas TaxID=180498 RepID=UPI0005FACE4F|nr:altered inheritance rate of mitochondria protein 25 isoform X2 [Jatropha curcas]
MNWTKRCRLLAQTKKFAVPLFNNHQHGIPRVERSRNLHCLQQPQKGWVCVGAGEEWWRMIFSRGYAHDVENDSQLSRNFLAQFWIADRKMEKSREKRKHKIGERSNGHGRTVLNQPPPSQSVSGYLEPASPEEENRYVIVDVCYPQSPAGFIREQSNVIARQLLRLRRPFVAYITDAMGNELFRVRRPFWWITSSIYAEINGKEIGVVHRRWHLWRRIYDLYIGNKQFAVVENPGLWNWTFTLKDINGEVLAQIDRDWRGFGFEIFTDAGQYVIRFGSSDPRSKTGPATAIHDLEVVRPLTLSERAVTLALAISLDNDYFSRRGGWGIPFVAVEE